jgi:hypothetical protein
VWIEIKLKVIKSFEITETLKHLTRKLKDCKKKFNMIIPQQNFEGGFEPMTLRFL